MVRVYATDYACNIACLKSIDGIWPRQNHLIAELYCGKVATEIKSLGMVAPETPLHTFLTTQYQAAEIKYLIWKFMELS